MAYEWQLVRPEPNRYRMQLVNLDTSEVIYANDAVTVLGGQGTDVLCNPTQGIACKVPSPVELPGQ